MEGKSKYDLRETIDIVLANPTAIVWTFRAGGAAGINQDNFNGLHRNGLP